jgi:hypothetical protein
MLPAMYCPLGEIIENAAPLRITSIDWALKVILKTSNNKKSNPFFIILVFII